MTRLSLEGVVRRERRAASLDWEHGPALEVAPSELLVLLGKPGAGKTALARLIAGLDTPDAGEIRVDGELVQRLQPHERGVAMIFQGDVLWPHWNVEQNIGFGLLCRGVSRGARRLRVDEVLAGLQLDGLARKKPGDLNDLQRWRVALARAIVLDPKLLLVDEPFAGLDDEMRDDLANELRRVHDEYRLTTLVFTSRAAVAMRLADRIAVMSVRGVLQVGRPTELYSRPRSRELAELFGPVNAIAATVENIDPRGEVVVRSEVGRIVGRCRPESLASGVAALVLARPEALVLSPGAGLAGNRFTTTVLRRSVSGPLCHVELRGPADWAGMATVLRSAAHTVRDGQALSVVIPPDTAFVVPGTSE